jgi:hypothetical protein
MRSTGFIRSIGSGVGAVMVALLSAVAVASSSQSDGWQIPRDAASEVSPLPETPERIARGRQIFEDKCQR